MASSLWRIRWIQSAQTILWERLQTSDLRTYKQVIIHQSISNFTKCRCLAFRCCCRVLIIGNTQQDQSGSWIPAHPNPEKWKNLNFCESCLMWNWPDLTSIGGKSSKSEIFLGDLAFRARLHRFLIYLLLNYGSLVKFPFVFFLQTI